MSSGYDISTELDDFGSMAFDAIHKLSADKRRLRAHVDDLVAENHELACRVEELERELDEALNALNNREQM